MTVVDFETAKRTAAANEARDATLWTPRDVLVEAIRAIDEGEISPLALAVVYLEKKGKGIRDGYVIATPSDETLGPAFLSALFLAEAFRRSVWEDSLDG